MMELVARIAVRLHEIGDSNAGESPNKSEKSVAIFRIVGHSLKNALDALENEVSLTHRPVVALAIPSGTMTKKQEDVFEAVVRECHRRSSRVFACGGDSGKLCGPAAAGGGADQWFSSVPAMIQALEKPDSRSDLRKQGNPGTP